MSKKKPARKKSVSGKAASRRKKRIQRKSTRFMETSGDKSAQIHQGVVSDANSQSTPVRRFPEDDAEYGGES